MLRPSLRRVPCPLPFAIGLRPLSLRATEARPDQADPPPPTHDNDAPDTPTPKRKRGRPRKDAAPLTSSPPPAATATRTRRPKEPPIPLSLTSQASTTHTSLATFLAHAAATNLDPSTTVYKGTHYEYTVASALRAFNFTLHRTGRSNDLGIDLVGHFALPASRARTAAQSSSAHGGVVKVIVQCKAVRPQPSMVRELEGAYAGAPAGWRGGDVLAVLVASAAATKGVRDAVRRSRWPMALMEVGVDGGVRGFVWNGVAGERGLEGLGVVRKYVDGEEQGDTIALTWLGRVVRTEQSES